MADEPEANGAEVQPSPASESDIRAEAIAAATARTGDGGEPAEAASTGTGPNTTPEDGDGGETPAEGAENTEAPEGTPDPYADMPSDPAELRKWLQERDEAAEAKARERLDNQKRSLLGNMRQEESAAKRKALINELAELDELALGERLKEDAEAASVWAEHVGATPPEVMQAGRDYLINEIVPKLFKGGEMLVEKGGPNLMEIMAADSEEAAAIDELEGGVYTWLVEKSLEAGAKDAVEKFKRSKEYSDAIEEAKTAAVQDALGWAGAPPSRTPEITPSSSGEREPSDPREAALLAGAKRAGRTLAASAFDDLHTGSGRGRRRVRSS